MSFDIHQPFIAIGRVQGGNETATSPLGLEMQLEIIVPTPGPGNKNETVRVAVSMEDFALALTGSRVNARLVRMVTEKHHIHNR